MTQQTSAPASVADAPFTGMAGIRHALPRPVATRRWLGGTPRRIGWLFGTATLALVAYATVSVETVVSLERAMRTIGYETAPSVVAAEKIRVNLADMEAQALDASQVNDWRANKAWWDFESARADLADNMTQANALVTFGDSELRPLRAIRDDLDQYSSLVGQSRILAGMRPALSASKARWAAIWMQRRIVPESEKLADANLGPMDQEFSDYTSSSAISILNVCLGAAAVMGILVGSQVWLMRRTKRFINPWLAASTLVVAASFAGLAYTVLATRNDLVVAKSHAFDSMAALYKTRSELYLMRADESMWMADHTEARAAHAASFEARLSRIADLDWSRPDRVSATLRQLGGAAASSREGRDGEAEKATPKIQGYLGSELDNITFGYREREPATRALSALADYVAIDRKIRDLDAIRQYDLAITLSLGREEGQSYHALDLAESAINETIQVNSKEFDSRIDSGMRRLKSSVAAVLVASLAAFLLAAQGFWSRYQEYR